MRKNVLSLPTSPTERLEAGITYAFTCDVLISCMAENISCPRCEVWRIKSNEHSHSLT